MHAAETPHVCQQYRRVGSRIVAEIRRIVEAIRTECMGGIFLIVSDI